MMRIGRCDSFCVAMQVPAFDDDYQQPPYLVTRLRDMCEYGCRLRCGFAQCSQVKIDASYA